MCRSDFFQGAFTKCVHIRKFLDNKVRSSTVNTKTKYLCIVVCPKKFTLAHNVFEVTEVCRTRADILKPTLDWILTIVASQITKI